MLTSSYVLPGLDPLNPSDTCQTQIIYDNISRFFNKSTNDFNRRFKDDVSVRYWTMFIARCKGISSYDVGSFFNKKHTTVLHAVNKIIAEIECYDDSRNTFHYMNSIFVIDPKTINSKHLKFFIISWKKQEEINRHRGIQQMN